MRNNAGCSTPKRERAAEARATRLGNWFGGFAFLLGLPSLVLAFMQAIGITALLAVSAGLGGSLLLGSILWGGLHLWLRRGAGGD